MKVAEIRDEISRRYHQIVSSRDPDIELLNRKIEIIMLGIDKLLELEQKRRGEKSTHNYI